MTTTQQTPVAPAPAVPLVVVHPRSGAWRAFLAILGRDLFVTGKEFWVFVIQVGLQPLFMLFVFAKVLGSLNYVRGDYGELLLPGILALTTFLTALQTVAFPLVMEFSFTKEIEDRLLAPLPTPLVAIEKLLVAVLRGVVAGLLMFPIGALVLGHAPWHAAGLPLLLVVLVLGAWVGAGIGLTIGTFMPPTRINIMFAVVLTPLMFTGAIQYPWPSLALMPWFQTVTAANPMTYCAEGVRAALVPHVPHIAAWICLLVLSGAGLLFTGTGVMGFLRRAID
jgi:ABC-2 type transport system permease protein